MSTAVPFEGANKVFNAPKGDEDKVRPAPVFANGDSIVTFWQFDADELAEIARTGGVYACVLSGKNMFPMYVGSRSDVQRLCTVTGKDTF